MVEGLRLAYVPLISACAPPVEKPSFGQVIVIAGGFFRKTTRREAVAVRPAGLVAWATRTLRPAARRTPVAVHVVPVTVAAVPLTSTLVTPELTLPLTVMLSAPKEV